VTNSPEPDKAPEPLCMLKAQAFGADDRYFTGQMVGRWPESLRSRDRAAKMPERIAKRLAVEFAALNSMVRWTAEPVTA
jgi:hypothetical protein